MTQKSGMSFGTLREHFFQSSNCEIAKKKGKLEPQKLARKTNDSRQPLGANAKQLSGSFSTFRAVFPKPNGLCLFNLGG